MKIILRITSSAVAALSLTILPGSISAQVSSTFDSGLDGWSIATFPFVTWQSSGGNPGGYVQVNDDPVFPAYNVGIRAPGKFLGNWSALNEVGMLTFDVHIFSVSGVPDLQPIVFLEGPGGRADWTQPYTTAVTSWEHIVVPMQQSSWRILSGTWDGVLANVTGVGILTSSSLSLDSTGIDNVVLVPEPSTTALLCLASLLALKWYTRRREF